MPEKLGTSSKNNVAPEECTVPQVSQGSRKKSPACMSNPVCQLGSSHPPGECTVPQVRETYKGDITGLSSAATKKRYQSPPKYKSKTEKRVAKTQRKLAKDSATIPHITYISPLEDVLSKKPLTTFPIHGKKTRNLVCSQGGVPNFIMETHSFAEAPSPTFVTLSEIISDLYMMALNCQHNKSNSNLLNGRMQGIGFCQGTDDNKSGGQLTMFY
jgi:hypothetical protein